MQDKHDALQLIEEVLFNNVAGGNPTGSLLDLMAACGCDTSPCSAERDWVDVCGA